MFKRLQGKVKSYFFERCIAEKINIDDVTAFFQEKHHADVAVLDILNSVRYANLNGNITVYNVIPDGLSLLCLFY